MIKANVIQKEAMFIWDKLISHFRTAMARRETEQFRVFFLDWENVLTADEPKAPGTVDHVTVYPRKVVKRGPGAELQRAHTDPQLPAGDPTPSPSDIEMTASAQQACGAIGGRINDHVIIGKAAEFSFRAEGLLWRITDRHAPADPVRS